MSNPTPADAIPTRFTFAWEPLYVRLAKPFGITPQNCWVDVDTETVDAHFGRWTVNTPVSNIRGVEVTGPYRAFKTAGPPRLGITDLGITFAANHTRGVRLDFRSRVKGVEPLGVLRHAELTLTVAEIENFAKLVRERAGLAT